MSKAYYGIRHCIHCGRKNFENFEEVLKHVGKGCKE